MRNQALGSLKVIARRRGEIAAQRNRQTIAHARIPHPQPSKPACALAAGGVRCALPRVRARRKISLLGDSAATRRRTRRRKSSSALHRHLGISRKVLVQASVHGHDNGAMLDAIARNPDGYARRRDGAPTTFQTTELRRPCTGRACVRCASTS